jgi:predicted SnoaL-like aldol condensation-catalyzing enzyme
VRNRTEEQPTMSETTEKNKQLAREIMDKIVNGGDVELAAKYYKEDYIQHNPMVGQGLEGLQTLLRQMHASDNPMQVKVKLINAEDDMVWMLLEWSGGNIPPGTPRIKYTAEIFRVEDGMMAEHWDVLQIQPD